jgi:L-cysteine S-thiosulfotransferase
MTDRVGVASALLLVACAATPADTVPYVVRGDAIVEPLTAMPGDPSRGREIVTGRDANCLLCHSIPETGQRFMGNVAPPLSGVGGRLSAGQIRLRVVDPTRVKADVAMPAYYRTHGLDGVAEAFRGAPVLTAQQVEDVVAYLASLRRP